MDENRVARMMVWVLVGGFALSHWLTVAAHPARVARDPFLLVQLWNGMSSVGGFLGAALAMVVFLKREREPVLPYADVLTRGLLVGWIFGRLGCALVHDHPGKPAGDWAWLAVGPWPDGSIRHDLGLYELLFTVALAAAMARWRPTKPGRLTGTVALAYAPVRFALDFLRADAPARGVTAFPDIRYGGLTAEQYTMVPLFLAGVWLVLRRTGPRDLAWRRVSG
jgi:phosphatidylglycerol:prolipoprotein diacylglycerol transferase